MLKRVVILFLKIRRGNEFKMEKKIYLGGFH